MFFGPRSSIKLRKTPLLRHFHGIKRAPTAGVKNPPGKNHSSPEERKRGVTKTAGIQGDFPR